MPVRLRDRQRAIPYGFRFYLPQVNWSPDPWTSFSGICDRLEGIIGRNPHLAVKHRWPTDRTGIENWVDYYNARVCEQQGWADYIYTDPAQPAPKVQAPLQQQSRLSRLAAVASGAKILVHFVNSKEEAVPVEVSRRRATACANRNGASCPKNLAGDWLSFFTKPAAEAIREKLEERLAMKLTTELDDKLGVCDACDCPLPLKVHIPIKVILEGLKPDQRNALDPGCWILSEAAEIEQTTPTPPENPVLHAGNGSEPASEPPLP